LPHVLIRELDPRVVKKLKSRARLHRRSLQAELKDILERAASTSPADVLARVERVRAMFRGRRFSDSAALIRRDRAR
jgi:plasmid stability protein